jgi:hypothetical protein
MVQLGPDASWSVSRICAISPLPHRPRKYFQKSFPTCRPVAPYQQLRQTHSYLTKAHAAETARRKDAEAEVAALRARLAALEEEAPRRFVA